jgi:hypothetical protein
VEHLFVLIGIFITVLISVAVLCAQLRLFKISDTLDRLLYEVRQFCWINQLRSKDPRARHLAIAALSAMLRGTPLPDRYLIMSILFQTGPEAKSALPALKEIMAKDDSLRQQAAETVREIDPTEFERLKQGQPELFKYLPWSF